MIKRKPMSVIQQELRYFVYMAIAVGFIFGAMLTTAVITAFF